MPSSRPVQSVPTPPAFGRFCDDEGEDAATLALTGGEDYELLVAVDPEGAARMALLARDLGVPLTSVGRLAGGSGTFETAEGQTRPLAVKGYEHFRGPHGA